MLFRAKKSTTNVTQEDLLTFIRSVTSSQGQTINVETDLLQDGLIDSVAMMELILWLEREKRITINEEDMLPENFNSVQVLHSFIESQKT